MRDVVVESVIRIWLSTYGGGLLSMSATLSRRLDVRLNQGRYFRRIFMYFEMKWETRTVGMKEKEM